MEDHFTAIRRWQIYLFLMSPFQVEADGHVMDS